MDKTMDELRKLMKDAGVTQQDMAFFLKMSPNVVSKYFNGKSISRRSTMDIENFLQDLRAGRTPAQDSGQVA